MPWIVPAISAATAIYSAVSANKQAKKAQDASQGAAQASQVDINAIDAKTREIARNNALQSAELERQLTPGVPALRDSANRSILQGLGGNPDENAARTALMGGLGQGVGSQLRSPLLQAAIDKAKANLDLGGQLPQDVQNLVTRRALAQSGNVAPGTLGLGRDLSARDLGLTSLDLQSQRLRDASQLGQQDIGVQQGNNDLAFNNASHLLNQIQLLRSFGDAGFNRSLAAGQFGESIQRPVVGLDPGSVADLYNANATNKSRALSSQANIAGAQGNGLLGLAGQLGGYGLLAYNSSSPGSNSGIGPKTTYDAFKQNNPYSSASLGG